MLLDKGLSLIDGLRKKDLATKLRQHVADVLEHQWIVLDDADFLRHGRPLPPVVRNSLIRVAQIGRHRPGYITAFALLLVTTLLALSAVQIAQEFSAASHLRSAVTQSYETRTQIQRVFSLLQDAETGQRGYVISGDRRFLEPYVDATGGLSRQMAELEGLFADRPEQLADFRELQRLVEQKELTLVAAIEARRNQGRDQAFDLVSEGQGKAVMDEIRGVVDAMIAREARELSALSQAAEKRTDQTWRLIVALFVALALALLTAVVLIWRYLKTRNDLLRRMRAVAARQEAVFDSAMDAILTLNPSGSIESINRAGERMFGWTAAELERRDVARLFDLADDRQGPFLKRIGAAPEALEDGVLREMKARRRDGSVFPIDVALGAMRLPTGLHVVAVVRDITERRRVEQMKAEFVSTVSHELRTPLTSIAGSLGLLAGGAAGALPERAGRLIGIAQANSQRLVRLINDILDVEKLEAGKLELDLRPLDLREIAARSIEGARGYADELGVALTLTEGDDAPVRGDADRLVQVVTNLLSNAAKFSPRGGAVTVNVYPEARIARLSVVDQGPGIPEAFRSRIFSKFAQADSSDTRSKGGTGLGLAIAREIAERHGGRLWFESTEGEGATFHLDLPLAVEIAPAAGGEPRVLIVEDDADAAAVLTEMLRMDGLAAETVETAEAAMAAIQSGDYVAALVDLGLPDQDGISLIRALRQSAEGRDLPVVVVSGDVARGRRKGRALEVLDWLDKPVDADRLRSAVAAIRNRIHTDRPLVLHVDDDRDILDVTRAALAEVAEIVGAGTLAQAREQIRKRTPDLIVLDLGLPDGSGMELLPEIGADGSGIPVVVYSAQEADAQLIGRVEAVLTKSRTSLTDLVRTVRRLSLSSEEAS
jgi:PAS domain S-box-containing protein